MINETQKNTISPRLDKLINGLTTIKKSQPKIPGLIVGVTDRNGTFYLNSNGKLNLEDSNSKAVNNDSLVAFYSCTKSMTAFAFLKLFEQGLVDLDTPVKKYLPEIDDIHIVEKGSINKETGEFTVPPRKPKVDITPRHLLVQTSGFSYPFLSDDYSILARFNDAEVNSINPTMALFKANKMPLVSEPGTEFHYGHGLDWIGLLVHRISGKSLGEFLQHNLFDPVGMKSCTFHLDSTDNLLRVHRRTSKGKLVFYPKGWNHNPQVDMGGQGCMGTVGDYLKFIRLWLNYGYCPDTNTRLLKEETVKYALQNHLPPGMTVEFELPGIPKIPDYFTLGGMAETGVPVPTGRPKGSFYWSGLANLYYWLDHENGVGGFWASQVLPTFDQKSFLGYCKLETVVYDAINGEEEDDDDDDDDDDDEYEEHENGPKL